MAAVSAPVVDLDRLASQVRHWHESLRLPDTPAGTYRSRPGPDGPVGFYACADMAILRWVTGEDLRLLPAADRAAWAGGINGFQAPDDGRYLQDFHSPAHANTTAVNALRLLGARHRYPVRLYDAVATVDGVLAWLEALPLQRPWRTSHEVWGTLLPFSLSARATPAWHDAVFAWLDAEQDPATGWWRKGVPLAADAPSVSGLGGAVHIFPLYRHQGRPVPHLDRMVAQVLRWHRESGFMTTPGAYGEMDGAYVLALGAELVPELAPDCREAGRAYLEALAGALRDRPEWFFRDVHATLGLLSGFGYLQRLLPDLVVSPSGTRWGDIFDHAAMYRLDDVWPPDG